MRHVGTFDDRVVAASEGAGMAQMELKTSAADDLPGVAGGDRVFRTAAPKHRSPAAAAMRVALVESATNDWLFVDANLDGRLTLSERVAYTPAPDFASARELSLAVTAPVAGLAPLPFRCRVVRAVRNSEARRSFFYTATFPATGVVDIAGQQTRVNVPFNIARGTVDTGFG